MMLLQKIILAFRAIGAINLVANTIHLFNKDTPQTIKKTCNENIIAKVKKKVREYDSEHNQKDSKYEVIIKDVYLHYATWYRHKADIFWGRASQLDRYKCAWYYVTSGQLYELANNLKSACDQYHFAANQFRDVGAYNQSIKYYIMALNFSSDKEWRERNKARAISVSIMAGETKIAELLQEDNPQKAIGQTH